MPPPYVAFLRAINVGGRRVKMERLRGLFESLGLDGVETFIASGNVLFHSADAAGSLERRIEAQLKEALGYEVSTFLRSAAELAGIVRHEPFPSAAAGERSTLFIGFLPAPPEEEARLRLLRHRTEQDDLHLHGREVYWLRRVQGSESPLSGAVLEKALGMPATLRNATTVRKLAEKAAARVR